MFFVKPQVGGNKRDLAGCQDLTEMGPTGHQKIQDTGREPVLGEKVGRPRKSYSEREAQLVRSAHARYRFIARMLEPVIRKQYKILISYNRIHMYLKAQGLAR